MISDSLEFPTAALEFLARATVRLIHEDGSISVAYEPDSTPMVCDQLVTAAEPVVLAPGDSVLCYTPPSAERGVILGRIGTSQAVPNEHAVSESDVPSQLVLEAAQELTLRVGEGSITIRADGKILIKGTDLVSHAKRMNRIKGGAVSIN